MISTKGRYALRVMIDLAQHKDEEYVPLNEIAIRQAILLQSPAWFQVPRSAAVKSSALHSLCGRNLMEWYMISSTRLHWKMC